MAKTLPKPKPDHIPRLYFGGLPGYVTSDDEDEGGPTDNTQQL